MRHVTRHTAQRVARCSSCGIVHSAVLALVLGSVGCYQPDVDAAPPPDDEFGVESPHWSLGAIARDAAAEVANDEAERALDADLPDASHEDAAPALKELTFLVTTSPVGGRFAPNNVGAIWIETGAGVFVKTLKQWGRSRSSYLRRFQAASRGNLVDAVTGATLTMHVQHEVHWDFRGLDEQVVPDGMYRVVCEVTDKNSTGASLEVPFVKDGQPSNVMPEESDFFRAQELTIE